MGPCTLSSTVVIILCLFCSISQAENIITVDQSGNGNYKKIQDAIDSIPSYNAVPVTISIKPGVYKEMVFVPEDKPFITLSGSSKIASDVNITWDKNGSIVEVATFHVSASDFTARYVTFQNTYGKNSPAVALRVSGNRTSFYDCSIIGYQDTLFDESGTHYYENCYIEGVVDYIFGSATSFYQDCHIHSSKYGFITAQHRTAANEAGGFVFFRGWITGEEKTHLGRPWRGSYARVIFAYTYMEDVIEPVGWFSWSSSDEDLMKNSFCGQFKCKGPGSTTSGRVKWVRVFTEEEVKPFLTRDFIDGAHWLKLSPQLPEEVTPSLPPPVPSPPPPMKPSSPPPVKIPPVMQYAPPPAPEILPPLPPMVIPSSPRPPPKVLPPPMLIPSLPPPAPVIQSSPPSATVILTSPINPSFSPPRPLMSLPPPPPSTMPVIIIPWLTPERPKGRREEGEPFMIYYSSGASSLLKNCFSGVATLALSSAVLVFLLA